MYDRKYIVGAEGNLSARLDGGRIIITPAGMNKGYMKPSDLIICDMRGEKSEGAGQPSTEIKIHLAAYRNRPDVMAVCHAHPVYAVSFSVAGTALDMAVLPEMVGTLGGAPLVEYASPGSAELAANLEKYIDRYDAFLLQSHGVLTLGRSLEESFDRMETVERFAEILFTADGRGGADLLSSVETERLLKAAGRSNLINEIICAEDEENVSGE